MPSFGNDARPSDRRTTSDWLLGIVLGVVCALTLLIWGPGVVAGLGLLPVLSDERLTHMLLVGTVFLATLIAFWFTAWRVRARVLAFEERRRAALRACRCPGCGYDLRGTPLARCPECADRFTPAEWDLVVPRSSDVPER